MDAGSATLPAEMISYGDGSATRQALAAGGSLSATMDFTERAVELNSDRLASFTAAGPNVDNSIKPDLVAVGTDMYVPTQTYDQNGDMYDPSGFILVDGTSFSTPMVAGVAALLKSARPGLTVAQYRSLLINSASPIDARPGTPAGAQQAGAGALNALAALHSTAALFPTSLSFGAGGATIQDSQTLTLTNVNTNHETYQLFVEPSSQDIAPVADATTLEVAPGASKQVTINWQASGLTAGAHEGVVRIVAASSGTETRVPYWYGVTSAPAHITILDALSSARRNSNQTDAILFRVTDAAGVVITDAQPQVSVVSGDGTVRRLASYDRDSPGLYGISVRLGPAAGSNVFRIQAGDAAATVTITGQ
jgi:minor extracellular serine protease Vpr